MITSGDDPAFFFDVPDQTIKIVAHAEWSPAQQAGLQFRSPGGKSFQSWNDADPTSDHFQPPIDMTIPTPEPGKWWAYFGPGIVGGGMTWNMTLTLDTLTPVMENATSQRGPS